jgi:hypothetical protein
MAYKETEPDDPMELVGVVLQANAEAMREMAYVFAEEFVRMGHDEERLLSLFKTPFYRGPHRAYRVLGEGSVRAIISECFSAWGRTRSSSIPSVSSVSSSGSNDPTHDSDEIRPNTKKES